MCNVTSKVLADDNMPCWAMSAVELLLDLCSDVLLDVVFLEGGECDVDALLLHLVAHVYILDDSLGCAVLWRGAGVGRGVGGCVYFLGHGGGSSCSCTSRYYAVKRGGG